MKLIRLFFLLALLPSTLFAQKKYWQQDLQYFIDVKLDAETQMLDAHQVLIYTNNSPDVLNELYIHVYPNAYANKKTAFAKQLLENGDLSFQKAKPEEMGYIDGLAFQKIEHYRQGQDISSGLSGKTLQWSFTDDIDIVKIDLGADAISPGEAMILYTPFQVKLPYVFSRGGYAEGIFHVSQWFPKPAVYDRYGWHPMPYLNQGEFYGDFARFEVSIEVPETYTVLGTGMVDNVEKQNMLIQANLDEELIRSTEKTKKVHYSAEQVHDFAWFASDQWALSHEEWERSDGEIIDVWIASLNHRNWKNAAKYTTATLDYLSREVGIYPYPQVTILEGGLAAGGGMEYPMITVIQKGMSGNSLNQVITHEVGHNWFYGILASNERDYPWMDESINSFYENRITNAPAELTTSNSFDWLLSHVEESLIRSRSKTNKSQSVTLKSEEYTDLNYGLDIYKRGPMMLEYLAEYLGEEEFKTMMQHYYQEWKFKHPQPEDLKMSWKQSVSKDIDWFFEWMERNQTGDVMVKKAGNKQIRLVNKTGIENFPIKVTSGEEVNWYQFEGKDTLIAVSETNQDEWNIGPIIDHNLINNSTANKLSLKPFFGLNLKNKETIYALPIIGGNAHDGFMLGLGFHNYTLGAKKFEFNLLPFYAFKSKSLTGQGNMRYNIWPSSGFAERVTFGIKTASYHHWSFELNTEDYFNRFLKIAPYVEIDLKKPYDRSLWSHQLNAQFDFIGKRANNFKQDADLNYLPNGKSWHNEKYFSVGYSGVYTNVLSPFEINAQALTRLDKTNIVKVSADLRWEIPYMIKNQKAIVRWFGGMMWYNTNVMPYMPAMYQWATTYTSAHDFTYEDIFVARSLNTSFVQNQIAMRDGGFKTSSAFYNQPIGISDSWLTALNVAFNIPKLNLPIRVYGDLSVYPDMDNDKVAASYALGVELYAGEILSVYFPIVLSQDFKDYKQYILGGKYGRLISLKLDLNALQLAKLRGKAF